MSTRLQTQLLAYLKCYIADHDGLSPSYEEMRAALQVRSKSNIHGLIRALEEQGFIRRLPKRARSIQIVEPADTALAALKRALAEYEAALTRREHGDVAANRFVETARRIIERAA